MPMRRAVAVTLAVGVIAVPSVALASSRVLHGPAGSGGVATIDIQFNIRHGRAINITRLEMNNIPASCRGSASTAVFYSFPHHIRISRQRTFHAKDVANGGRKPGYPMLFENRPQGEASLRKLGELEFDAVHFAHGSSIDTGAAAAFRNAWS